MWHIERSVFPAEEEEKLIATLTEREVPFREYSGVELRSALPEVGRSDVVRGSCWLIAQLMESTTWNRELWGEVSEFSYAQYAPRYRDYLLNVEYRRISFHELCWRREAVFPDRPDAVFVRPDDGFKSIEGQLVRFEEFDQWVTQCELLQVRGSAPLIVAPAQPISTEWRCFVVDEYLLTGSEYRPKVIRRLPPEVRAFVKEVIQTVTPPCRAYALDVVETPSGFRIVEIGCLCCVAFYASETRSLVAWLGDVASK